MSEDQDQRAVDQLRMTLAEGFSFVRGMEATAAAGAVSFENVIADYIRALTEDQSDIRPARINAILALQQEVERAVERIRLLPESTFSLSESDSANTAATEEDTGDG